MEINEKILEFARNTKTPFMLFDLEILEYNYNRLKKSMNGSEIFYAVKSNSHRRVLKRLIELGSSFDVASVGELELVMSLGASPEKISYGNPIKKPEDIKFAYEKGVRLFVADEFIEVDKIAENAPGSLFFVRLEIVDSDSDWPLSKKFGTNVDKAKEILIYSRDKGLVPYGVSFHVGSQCYDKYVWKMALFEVKDIFDSMREAGIELKLINTGGGMPVKYVRPIPMIEDISKTILDTIDEYFSEYKEIRLIAEPGRSLVGDTSLIGSSVVLRSQKQKNDWIYVDTGVYHGIFDAIEHFKYKVEVPEKHGEQDYFTLAGPTCDSIDTMYNEIKLPGDIWLNDKVFFMNTGAYAMECFTNFNGIKPPEVYFMEDIELFKK